MKTSLNNQQLTAFLNKQLGNIANLQQMVEGEESQAFSFQLSDKYYVIRVNPDIKGFIKDDYAYKHFTSSLIPIPKVVQVGEIDNQHAYCISEKAFGITFQDADTATIEQLLNPVTKLWQAIGATDISATNGYGDFDGSGSGKFPSWKEYLVSALEIEWGKFTSLVDMALVAKLSNEYKVLIDSCPEERRLVHGDFGSNNLLVNENVVTAVLDWENALYGDPLFDIAGAYFWRTWLTCMEKSAQYWEKELSSLHNYHKRLRCYQLRTSLNEIYDNANDSDIKMLDWLQNRAKEILNQ